MSVVVTGVAELDKALGRFEARVQKKYVRQALNKSVAIVEKDYKANVPVGEDEDGNDTGVMRDATKRVTPKKKKRGQLKRSLIIDRDKLMHLYFQRYGRFPGKRKQDNVPFFYPAVVELGGPRSAPQKPMRAALYGNEEQVKAEFIKQLKDAIATAGK